MIGFLTTVFFFFFFFTDAFTFIVIGMILLLIAQLVNDKLILTRMSNARGLMQGNVATATVEGGGYVAAALLITGAVQRE